MRALAPGGWVALGCVLVAAGGMVAAATGSAGPDPAKWLLHRSGLVAVLLLLATLAISSWRRRVSDRLSLRWRRPLGLAGFAFACLHLLVYIVPYQGLSWPAIADDLVKRPYIWIGAAALLLLLPLAATSTLGMRRRLGSPLWQRIHRLLYVIVPLAIVHQGMAQKADLLQTLVFAAITACFLGERWWFFARKSAENTARKPFCKKPEKGV